MIAGVGACVLDRLIELDRYPAEDSKVYAADIRHAGGGPCATALVTAAILGAKSSYIGSLADDEAGCFLYGDFRRYGVDTSLIHIIRDVQSFTADVLLNRKTATRTCILHRGTAPPPILDDTQLQAVASAELLMVDGCHLDAAVAAASAARHAGVSVLYDAGGLYEDVERLLPLCNILIPSAEFALSFTGETDTERAGLRLMTEYRPEVVVITEGRGGGLCLEARDVIRYPSFAVDAVDTNGAGDVFHGAFAYGLTRGWPYRDCCVFSSAAAALKCTALGARESVPQQKTVAGFLANNGYDREGAGW